MSLQKRRLRRTSPPRLLVVTAVEREREALWRGYESATVHSGSTDPAGANTTILAGGVGPAAAAASAAAALVRAEERGEPFLAVVSAGIAGGFNHRVQPGDTVLGSTSVGADLGAESGEGFLSLEQLGFGTSLVESDADLMRLLAEAIPAAVVGSVLTVSTVTGTDEGAAALRARHPDAVAEAMEGFGVATAASQSGYPFAEVRTISNLIGPRDRGAWRIAEALAALTRVGSALASLRM